MSMKIKTYEFVSMQGNVPAYGEAVEDLSRPGLDGHTFRLLGKRGQQFQLTTKSTHNTASVAKNAASDYSKLQGSFVTLEKGELSFSQLLVVGVASDIKKIGCSSDGREYMVETIWSMIRAG